MAKQVKAWQASDGSLHEDECAAATRDVELMVERSPLAENTPYAKQLVTWLTTEATMIRKMLEAHESACPRAVAAEPDRPLIEDESTGVTKKATHHELNGHTGACQARATGWFRHCNCGWLSDAKVEAYKRLSDAAFPAVASRGDEIDGDQA